MLNFYVMRISGEEKSKSNIWSKNAEYFITSDTYKARGLGSLNNIKQNK